MSHLNRLTAAAAMVAALSLSAPASAIALPRTAGPATVQAYDGDANSAEHRRWRRHRGGGIDGGDILAGVLILGGIAAVAGAIENNNRNDGYRDYPPPPQRDDYRGGYEGDSGLERAADICADAIERTIDPIGAIDSVRRGASGWHVDGTLRDGSPFACTIGNDGRIEDIRTDRSYRGAAYDAADPDADYAEPYDAPYDHQAGRDAQWDDETYARLRQRQAELGAQFGG